jgi:hypothetical protein
MREGSKLSGRLGLSSFSVQLGAGQTVSAISVEAKEPAPAVALWFGSALSARAEPRLPSRGKSRRLNMTSEIKSRMVSRRRMVSLLGLAAALGFAVSPTGAEAQTTGTTGTTSTTGTAGMHRRQERRGGRVERRYERRGGTPAHKQPAQTPSAQTPTAQTPPAQK